MPANAWLAEATLRIDPDAREELLASHDVIVAQRWGDIGSEATCRALNDEERSNLDRSSSSHQVLEPQLRQPDTSRRLPLRVIRRHRLPRLLPVLNDRIRLARAVQHVQLPLDHLGNRLAGRPQVVAR